MNCSTIIFPIERELPEEKEHSSFSKRKQSRWINFLVVFDNLQRPDTSHYPSLALEILSAKRKEHLQPWRVVWINILAFATSPNAMWLNNTWRSTKKHSVPMQTLHKYTAHRRRHQTDTLMKTHAVQHNSIWLFHMETQTSQKESKKSCLTIFFPYRNLQPNNGECFSL